MNVTYLLTQPWPWYVAGPLIGLMVPLLLLLGNKPFGISSNLRHMCAMIPNRNPFFNYDWRKESWNLIFFAGILLGGFVGGVLLGNPEPVALSARTAAELQALGVPHESGLMPTSLFSWASLLTLPGFILMVVGGFLVGFGARYAGGCTSGHAISGLSNLQLPSLIAVMGFFIGGLFVTHLVLPWVLRL
ncbi:MAG: YeeE/YedE family protein [Deinococcota bacterium]|jgi:uncharacterized membrane protein YedE/YeeE|nr:YeeE/YedE family protein [Deinococcota bacterium]